MSEIEQKILVWRERMLASLPAARIVVDELEDHLRESVEALTSRGVPMADAFYQASKKIGTPEAIALQYSHLKPKGRFVMKPLRVVATTIIGLYLLLMGLQFIAICAQLVQKRISPYSAEAPAAFFGNLLVCTLCSLALWLIWRKQGSVKNADNKHARAS